MYDRPHLIVNCVGYWQQNILAKTALVTFSFFPSIVINSLICLQPVYPIENFSGTTIITSINLNYYNFRTYIFIILYTKLDALSYSNGKIKYFIKLFLLIATLLLNVMHDNAGYYEVVGTSNNSFIHFTNEHWKSIIWWGEINNSTHSLPSKTRTSNNNLTYCIIAKIYVWNII